MTKRKPQNNTTDIGTHEWILPLSTDPYVFVGRKPLAVIFNDERVEVKSWREVFIVILKQCNDDYEHHNSLMSLRDKLFGNIRVLLSKSTSEMTRPVKIDEDMFAETHYGSQTLMHILVQRILLPVQFDYSNIKIVIKR